MADAYSENEQLDQLKGWWKKHGNSFLIGVLLALAIFFGWRAWQNHLQQQANAASILFDQVINMTASQTSLDQATRQELNTLVNELNNQYSSTLYAQMARFIQARVAVQSDDNATALAAIQQLLQSSKDPFIQGLARLDLARLQINQSAYDQALETLNTEFPTALRAQQANIRGDAYLALQKTSLAREAYQQALQLAQENKQSLLGVELKLADIAVQENHE